MDGEDLVSYVLFSTTCQNENSLLLRSTVTCNPRIGRSEVEGPPDEGDQRHGAILKKTFRNKLAHAQWHNVNPNVLLLTASLPYTRGISRDFVDVTPASHWFLLRAGWVGTISCCHTSLCCFLCLRCQSLLSVLPYLPLQYCMNICWCFLYKLPICDK